MKNNSVIILAGAALAGLTYVLGRINGHNECLYKCQQAAVNTIVDDMNKEKES